MRAGPRPMLYLLVTSLLWAFSFGLIKGRLVGVDPDFVAFARLALSSLLFLPWLRLAGLSRSLAARLVWIGAIQFGLMYVLYIRSYAFLAAHEVALFTVLTPLYVALLSRRRARARALAGALLACGGAACISWHPLASERLWTGFWLVQCANLCFAWGQLAYRRLDQRLEDRTQASVFGLATLGGCLVAGLASAGTTDWSALALTRDQWLTLLYLGLLPSGLGFFLWNRGATRVREGQLAVMNDLKVPLAIVVSLTLFGEHAQLAPLLLGSTCIAAALWFVRTPRPAAES